MQRPKRKRLSLLLICVIVLQLLLSAAADDSTAEISSQAQSSWDAIMEQFMKDHYVIDGTIAFGYKNLATGEEHYILPDKLMLAASIYKVPLNMYYTNKIYNGELSWDMEVYGVDYSRVIEWSIINSNNEYSIGLWQKIGNFTEFRDAMRPLINEEGTELDPIFYRENYFSTRQIICFLDELYNHSEEYPRVMECMLQAKPNQYFRENDHGLEVAQKYGYLDGDYSVTNNCGIIFTDEPIALAVLTTNAYKGYKCIVDYGELMIDYVNSTIS